MHYKFPVKLTELQLNFLERKALILF